MASKCALCDKQLDSNFRLDGRCEECWRCNQAQTFVKMLEVIRNLAVKQANFDETYQRCRQLQLVIDSYSIYITILKQFKIREYNIDKIAIPYLCDRLPKTDIKLYENYCPIELETSDQNNNLLKSIAFLCSINTVDNFIELRVRNIIDMVLNADTYIKKNLDLNELQNMKPTWLRWIVDNAREETWCQKDLPNSATTSLRLYSLSNVLNVIIKSLCPQMFGHADSIHHRLHRTYTPLSLQKVNAYETPIHILWSSKTALSCIDTSSPWLPDRVVPLLPLMQVTQLENLESNEMYLPIPDAKFYLACPCKCSLTQRMLDRIVTEDDQKNYREADENKRLLLSLKFQCPHCPNLCTGYEYDDQEMDSYKRRFVRGRYTYILIDKTSSMSASVLELKSSKQFKGESKKTRVDQTKLAIKALLRETALHAGPLDKVEVNTFDKELAKPTLIPPCDAQNANTIENQNQIDSINLRWFYVSTHFFEALSTVYDLLDRRAYYTIQLYIFSDGNDTSDKPEDNESLRNLAKSLHEKLGVNCRFIACGISPANINYLNFDWLVGRNNISVISGGEGMINEQCARIYQQDHSKNQPSVSTVSNEDIDERYIPNQRHSKVPSTPSDEGASTPNVLGIIPYITSTTTPKKQK
ncbi:unnamed protein product [Rotaria magnacalcarata]|uniref:VWFA domain-containing protein n=3 Tax=Rotaria magnacalcarata TaxID=392030 RepID=A0A815D7X6_9BILA|nr:unnamed protein product [Rotaria magnacalcarata]